MSFGEYAKVTGLKLLGFLCMFGGICLAITPLLLSGIYHIPVALCIVALVIGALIVIFGFIFALYQDRRLRDGSF